MKYSIDVIPFDDRDAWIWLDGALVPLQDARIHLLTHSLHYGGGAIEGERVYGGRVFKLDEHNKRLRHSCQVLGIDLPYTDAELDSATYAVISENRIVDGYVRPLAWRGSEAIRISAKGARSHLAIAAWPFTDYFDRDARQHGVRLTFSRWVRPSPKSAPTDTKAAGLYITSTLGRRDAEDTGFDDALMLDYRGLVAEATVSNIFLLKDGRLNTPTPDCFLDGITRRTAIDLARARGREVVVRAIRPEELADADEVFLTGTAVEIVPVRQIAEHHYDVGPVALQLCDDYRRLVYGG
jgi:branched-chain amino acid aminotransferase